MEFYSARKKNEISPFTSKWTELENIILNKITQAQKAKNHMFSLICELLLDVGHTLRVQSAWEE
jgi:hypothetical protein